MKKEQKNNKEKYNNAENQAQDSMEEKKVETETLETEEPVKAPETTDTEEEGKEEEPQEVAGTEQLSELDTVKGQLAEVNDKYIRLVAEFDNYRRRTAKERLELIGSAGEDVLRGFLPVMDDCERAIKLLRESEAAKDSIDGIELIYRKLEGYLRSKGMAKIDAQGKEFDTDFHEAVAQMPAQDKKQKNKVIDVIQQGYTLNGKVVRYAKVVIGI